MSIVLYILSIVHKAITPSFTERGTIVCPAATVNSKLRAIENLFESCDNKLAGAEMSGCGYTSQSGEIDSMTENMRNLSLYAVTAHERVSDHLDRPLYEHFKKNATETITAINLSEITTENTFELAEYVEIKRQGQYFVNKSVKNNLTMKDFLGLQEITAEDGTPILENAETMWEFASLFRLEYDTMTEKAVDLDSYLNWYLDTGDAEHKGYHPTADMISGILDITIVKPVLECILGKDLITGEYLTEYDIRWKSAGIIIDLVTLGGGSKLIKGGMSLKEFLKASGKTLTVDALTVTATYGTAYIGEEIGLSEEAILVLSTLAGIGTSYTAGKAIIKDAVEGGSVTSLRDLMTPEEIARYDVYWNNVADDMLKNNINSYRQAILNGDITKPTGGKINSKVVTAAIDTNTGDIYYGISGMNNNPTRNAINPQMQAILDSVDGTMTNYPLENCGEFNAINNALNNGVDINALRVYSVDRVGGKYKAPCINCQNLYGNIVHFTE